MMSPAQDLECSSGAYRTSLAAPFTSDLMESLPHSAWGPTGRIRQPLSVHNVSMVLVYSYFMRNSFLNFSRRSQVKKSVLACTIATIGFAMCCSIAAFADESTAPTPVTTPKKHHRHHGGFEFGICVGQALAKAGVVLP